MPTKDYKNDDTLSVPVKGIVQSVKMRKNLISGNLKNNNSFHVAFLYDIIRIDDAN